MPRPSDRPAGAVWRLLEQWSDEHELHPNQSQMANMFGVSGSLVSSWKFCDSLMQTDDINLVSKKTGIPFTLLAEAAAEDAPRALETARLRRGTKTPNVQADLQAQAGERNQDLGE